MDAMFSSLLLCFPSLLTASRPPWTFLRSSASGDPAARSIRLSYSMRRCQMFNSIYSYKPNKYRTSGHLVKTSSWLDGWRRCGALAPCHSAYNVYKYCYCVHQIIPRILACMFPRPGWSKPGVEVTSTRRRV